jgi:RNA polymerase sigma-70 factor (TIGR02943 family)
MPRLSPTAVFMTKDAPVRDFADQVAQHHAYLMRFARLQLRNEAWAEDAVAETQLAALQKPQAFAGRSQLKTWLVGILKYKIRDLLHLHRHDALANHDADAQADPLDDMGFDARGHHTQPPADWGDPQQHLHQHQFIQVLELCLEKLPPVQARLFLMREWLELSADETCKQMNLTATNLYVQLHRARLRLRACLDLNWFAAH